MTWFDVALGIVIAFVLRFVVGLLIAGAAYLLRKPLGRLMKWGVKKFVRATSNLIDNQIKEIHDEDEKEIPPHWCWPDATTWPCLCNPETIAQGTPHKLNCPFDRQRIERDKYFPKKEATS